MVAREGRFFVPLRHAVAGVKEVFVKERQVFYLTSTRVTDGK